MNVLEALPYSLFCFAVVFAVLACLWLLIRLFSVLIEALEKQLNKSSKPVTAAEPVKAPEQNEAFSSGELKLYHVDEPTAAMIMAIVSDESGIPLSELSFKSIKAIEPANNN